MNQILYNYLIRGDYLYAVDFAGEQLLLERIRASDYEAFEEMHKLYYPLLFGLALKKLNDTDEAYDLLQDMFMELWEKRQTFHISNPLPNYLKNRLWFKLSGYFRRQGFRDKHLSAFAQYLDWELVSPEDLIELQDLEVEYQQLIDRIDQVVDAMPDKMRTVFRLSREGKYAIAEIASQLGISPKTVSRQINMGLEHIRRSIGDIPLSALQLVILVYLTKS